MWDAWKLLTILWSRRHHNYHIISLIKISVISSAGLNVNKIENFLLRWFAKAGLLAIRYRSFTMVKTVINYLLNSSYYSFIFRYREIILLWGFFSRLLWRCFTPFFQLEHNEVLIKSYWQKLLSMMKWREHHQGN